MDFRDLSLTELRDLSEAMATVAGASEAGVFQALHGTPATPSELSRRLELDPRAVDILLPFLVQLELLRERSGGRYELTDRAAAELGDPDSPEYAAGGLPLWLANLAAWTELSQALRTGEPVTDQENEGHEDDGGGHLARYMAAMAAAPRKRVQRLVDGVLGRRPEARTLLDLGGGPGHISRAFVERGIEATLLDLPETVDFVGSEYGLDRVEGLRTVGADFLEDPLPEGPFDLVLLSNILHMLSPAECRMLLGKVADVSAAGTVLAVADFIRGKSPRAARFAVVMLLRTEGGNTYSLEDHRNWFQEVGFGGLEVRDLDADRQLLTAVRDADRGLPARTPGRRKRGEGCFR